jgi:hypothetical protein
MFCVQENAATDSGDMNQARAQLAPELMWGTAKLILDTVPGEDGEPGSRQTTTRAVPDVLTSRLS